ncbi:hypothetical protein [Sediminimonas sp.]|uniref:hypothetical protein n=1 Tax=Sediminimonas sp. TaxID=2823379 RepID=UPI0025D410A2|nr:hypothetical protein [Sediminimonas sp.]
MAGAGSFLQGLAGGISTGRGMRRQRSITDALDRLNGSGDGATNSGGGASGGTPSFIPENTAAGRSVVSEGQRHGSGRGDYASEFDASLSRTESGGRYDVVNDEGYTGKYQFGQERLDDFNRATGSKVTTNDFVSLPKEESRKLQERVQDWHVRDIDGFIESNGLDKYLGQEVGGVRMTRNGMRAMAHLGGKNGMRKLLTSGGKYNPADSNKTSLLDYAKTHAGAPSRGSGTPKPKGDNTPAAERVARSIFGDESPAQRLVRMFYRKEDS